jgi:aspartate oxidase
MWWESTNLRHLYPIGEVNGSHGVARPGGTALNAGQVGGIRAAEWIANRYAGWTLDETLAQTALYEAAQEALAWSETARSAPQSWRTELDILRQRMSRFGAHIRSLADLLAELPAAWEQVHRLLHTGCAYSDPGELGKAYTVRQLCFAHAVYLDAILYALQSKTGSRGSAIVLDPQGQSIHPQLGGAWRILPEDPTFRSQTLETVAGPNGAVHRWVACRPIPQPDSWFETTWARFRSGEIYQPE